MRACLLLLALTTIPSCFRFFAGQPSLRWNDCRGIAIAIIYGIMGQILVHNFDDAVIEALRRRAAAAGTSIEAEARRALAAAVGLDREAVARRLAEVRRRIGWRKRPSILEDLRRDRARDQG